MQRLFISVNCDEKVKNQILSVQEKIKTLSLKGNFSSPENLHLTLVFLGETPDDAIQPITSVIDKALVPPVAPFELTFTTAGCFKHSNKELWWIGTDHNDMNIDILKTIRQRITNDLLSKGIHFDNRPFNPHITLGREIKHELPIIIPKQGIIFPVNRISLMKSERISGKLTYTEIFGRDLEGE
ncbi:MAG: RNA 2',3'-cyclic phosphodiesterase [Brevinematales bacterium]|nr:RNA 2',3'-cyclic phosphodiesterase [Brevinematales bacterium]